MKYDLRTTIIILALFFLSQIAGLFIINQNIKVYGEELFEPSGEEQTQVLVTLPVSIIIMTALFLVIFRYGLKILLVLWYGLAFVLTSFFSMTAFINELYAIIISIALLIIKFKSDDDYVHNMGELLVYGGLAVVFLPLLSPLIMMIVLVLVSVYDVFSVFYSKHMITLAKSQESLNIFSGLRVRVGNSVAMLGGGDMAFPLMFAGTVFRDYGPLSSILVVYGALIGLLTLIMLTRKNKFYPAMPLISLGCLLGYGLTLFS